MSSIIYGITAVVALALLIGYLGFFKQRDIWLFLLLISVVLVNAGYFSISVSKILEEALLANRISYLGSVFLPLCMFMSVANVCYIRIPKAVTAVLLCVSMAVFLLAASPGYCDLYYKEVTLQIVEGAAKLVKVYGKLHVVYLIYLLLYFIAMIATVGFVIIKKKITSHKYASMLTAVTFLNMLIWLLEQLVSTEFEFLSISYIASEIILLFLFSIKHDYDTIKGSQTQIPVTETETESIPSCEETAKYEKIILSQKVPLLLGRWEAAEPLTAREIEVLTLIIDNCKRKEIAEQLCLSENTVKTHTSHIFSKLGIKGKNELIEKAAELLETD